MAVVLWPRLSNPFGDAMSKPQAKRRYRARKAARNMLRRYPFMRGFKRMREWVEESRGARPILIAAGRRGGETILSQEALDRLAESMRNHFTEGCIGGPGCYCPACATQGDCWDA